MTRHVRAPHPPAAPGPTPEPPAAYLQRVRELYDRVTPIYVAHCSETIQAGLVVGPPTGGRSIPEASDLWLAARAGVQPGERLLDLGCGVCGPSSHIAAAWPDVHIDAITVSAVQATLARERLQQGDLADRVTVHVGDYHTLPFDDGSFDLAFFFESSGYAYDPDALFAEVRRVLRPGGRVYIKDLFARPGPYSASEAAEIDAVNALWAQRRVPVLADWQARLVAAGFVELEHQRLLQVDSAFYWGAMFDEDLTLNAFGQEFFRDFPSVDLVFYGEIRGRKPPG